MLFEIFRDIRQSLRMLANNPGFAAVAILVMAIGIGANTATFTLVDKLLFDRLPYPGLGRFHRLSERSLKSGLGEDETSPADFFDWKPQATSFEQLVAFRWISANLAGEGHPERVQAVLTTPNLFTALEVPALFGRTFLAEEGEEGKNHVAILSYAMWQRRFMGSAGVLDKTIMVDGVTYTIAGVMPEAFDFPAGTQMWLPMAPKPEERATRNLRYLNAFGKLKPDVSVDQARAEMHEVAQRLARQYPETNTGVDIKLAPAREQLSGGELTAKLSLLTLGAVNFVLLIACVNVANLQLTRLGRRNKEVALRLSLGAGRMRMARLVLTESTLLAVLGAGLGLFLAGWCVDLMRTHMPAEMSQFLSGWQNLKLNGRGILATSVASLIAGIFSGLAPMLQVTKTDLSSALKQVGRAGLKSGRRVQKILVVGEVAVALVLLVGAGLMVSGVAHLLQANSALDPETVVTMRVTLPARTYAKPSQIAAFQQRVLEGLRLVPGVESAVVVSSIPFGLGGPSLPVAPIGDSTAVAERPIALVESVSPDYFRTLHIPLRAGREFDRTDTSSSRLVAIVSVALAKRLWPGQDAIGRHLSVGDGSERSSLTVVGVAADIKQDWFYAEPAPTVYRPYWQAPTRTTDFAIRAARNLTAVTPAARLAVTQVDSSQPVYNLMRMSTMINTSLRGLAYVAVIMGAFGAIALLLTALGIFGVLACTVAEQTREIGIKMALGARPLDVQLGIMGEGFTVVGIGFGIGLASSIALAKVMSSLIFGVSPLDPTTFVGIAGLLALVALFACYVPARRAMKIEPAIILRGE
jgi:putative ABC transport system permease protein